MPFKNCRKGSEKIVESVLKMGKSAFHKLPKRQWKNSRNCNENSTVKVQWLTTSIRWLSKGQWKCRGKWDTGKTCTFGSENICSALLMTNFS